MSARLLSGLLLTISLLVCVTANTWHPTPEDFKRFMGDAYTGTESFVELRSKIIARVRDTAADYIEHHPAKNSLQSKDYPYFGFVPQFLSTIVPGGASASWEALCFQKNTATATANPANPNEITLTLTLSQPKSLLCSDNYLFATVSGLQMKSFFFHGTHNVTWTLPTNASASEAWDLSTKGVRVFQFLDNSLQTVADLLSTVLLFGSELSKNVPQWVSNVNLDFLAKYAGVKMTPRKVQSVSIDESLIHSGDFFGVMRLDGLDPMLAWAMGATTGHTTVALRDPTTGQLYVCESTTNSNYWPTNGIQKTPYQQWILQARAAGYHVVHAPLSADARAAFNETAAWEFFRGVEGLDYGFYNMLWGWIDTLEENYPCLPPDFKVCLQWQHMEVVFALVNRLVPSISDLMWGQAFNIRVGTEGLPMSDVYYQAAQQSLAIESVPTLVEKDDFNYTTHRGNVTVKDKSMVCCVFVCNMWKHAGVFDSIGRDSVNCAELTNWDDYALSIFDTTTPRPEACVNADPENPLCQLEGQYTLSLNDFATKKPYSHMAERCPSQPPAYKKPADC